MAPPVLSYLRANRAADPEDLLGEVMLQVVRDIRRFSGGERDFRAWVLTIAHHRLLDDRRRSGRRPVDPTAPEDMPERASDADAAAEALARLDDARVQELIGRLSADQRTVLLLRVIGDLTVQEVARAMGKRPGAIKALQRRGVAALQDELLRADGGAA